MAIIFSSRRQELTDEQLKLLMRHERPLRLADHGHVEVQPVEWQATTDADADQSANLALWESLAERASCIAGDFPHAALEALRLAGRTSNGDFRVYVRIYKIGGGFKRDTEFLRWARIR